MVILYIFIAGITTGSFLNACIYRIPRGENIILGFSHCPRCGRRIKALDLVPVLSFFVLRGRCRSCGCRISFRYPAVEFASGMLWVMLFMKCGSGLLFLKYALFVSVLILVGMIDHETGEVYTSTIAFGVAAGGLFAALVPGQGIDCILGALAGFAVISAIAITGGMGWGDADICLLCGLFLGFSYTLLMIFISFIIGAAAGLIMITLAGKAGNERIAFGPYIAASAIITLFFGDNLILLYLNMIA
jgi:leader peptidase (prepilin peptidase) / N-methyltransferase